MTFGVEVPHHPEATEGGTSLHATPLVHHLVPQAAVHLYVLFPTSPAQPPRPGNNPLLHILAGLIRWVSSTGSGHGMRFQVQYGIRRGRRCPQLGNGCRMQPRHPLLRPPHAIIMVLLPRRPVLLISPAVHRSRLQGEALLVQSNVPHLFLDHVPAHSASPFILPQHHHGPLQRNCAANLQRSAFGRNRNAPPLKKARRPCPHRWAN